MDYYVIWAVMMILYFLFDKYSCSTGLILEQCFDINELVFVRERFEILYIIN